MNPHGPIRQMLVANTALNTGTGGRLYGPPGLPRAAIDTKAVTWVITEAEPSPDNAPIQRLEADFACWGATVDECWTVYDLLHTALDGVTQSNQTTGYVMVAREIQGGIDAWHDEIEKPCVAARFRFEFRR